MYIFGIPRFHRVPLCIWFPHHMGVLTLAEVKTRSEAGAAEMKKRKREGEHGEGEEEG